MNIDQISYTRYLEAEYTVDTYPRCDICDCWLSSEQDHPTVCSACYDLVQENIRNQYTLDL